ncbi:MAG TPA: hypothetical protein VFP54_13010 [Acidimicrobiales bacterium]|nr:hypothetical protein [Acidimicrobiales bacterium]
MAEQSTTAPAGRQLLSARRAALLAAGVAVVTAVPACGGAGAAVSHLYRLTAMRSPAGQAEILLTPQAPVRGLVLFEHGYGEDQSALVRIRDLFGLRDALMRAGLAIAASNSHGNNMGGPASVADQTDLLADAERRLAGVPAVGVIGFSMGGLDALMVASRHVLPDLRAVVVISGMCDQIAFLGDRVGHLGRAIRTALAPGLHGAAAVAAVARSDPERQNPQSFAGYRYWFWQSPADRIVYPSQASGMVAFLRRAGITARLSALDGNHGDLSRLRPDLIAAFVQG